MSKVKVSEVARAKPLWGFVKELDGVKGTPHARCDPCNDAAGLLHRVGEDV